MSTAKYRTSVILVQISLSWSILKKRFVLKKPLKTCDLFLQAEEVDAKAEEIIPANIREQLASTNWKERLAGTEALTQVRLVEPAFWYFMLQLQCYCMYVASFGLLDLVMFGGSFIFPGNLVQQLHIYTRKNDKLLKTGLNNVVLPILLIVVNNIEQVVEHESSPQSGVTMLNNIVDNIEQCGQHNIVQSCFQQPVTTHNFWPCISKLYRRLHLPKRNWANTPFGVWANFPI